MLELLDRLNPLLVSRSSTATSVRRSPRMGVQVYNTAVVRPATGGSKW